MKNKNLLIALGIGAAVYFFAKKKSPAPTGTNSDVDQATDLEHQYFNQMSAVLEADPVFLNGFPGDFYEAVQTDFNAQKEGQPSVYNNDPVYKTGLPGAFMGVADAWMSAMNYSDATHNQLWMLYNQYCNQLAKQTL